MTDQPGLATVRKAFSSAPYAEIPARLDPPANRLDIADAPARLTAIGEEVLRAGQVAVITLVGGRSTRYGGRFRGDIEVGPVTGRTLFELQGERVSALRFRKAPGLRWLIMVSPATAAPVDGALRRADWFGIPRSDVWIFEQPLLPVVDEHLDAARRRDGSAITAPGGHGALLEGLIAHGFLARLSQLGVRYVFAFQYPNVLEKVGDPAMLGFHHAGGHDATAKGVTGRRAGEPAGRLADVGGRVLVIEYHYLKTTAHKRAVAGCPLWTGTMVWSVSFLQRCARDQVVLPHHLVNHAEPGDTRPLRRAEQFIFDLLEHSRSTGVVLGSRDCEFAMLKTISGPESLESARTALVRMYLRWLTAAGAVADGPVTRVEIGARFALSASELAKRLPPRFRYRDGLVLSEGPSGAGLPPESGDAPGTT